MNMYYGWHLDSGPDSMNGIRCPFGMKIKLMTIVALSSLSACSAKVAYPPDQAGFEACNHDCLEQWKNCQGPTCAADRSKCVDHCRDYGGMRGGGKVAIEVPFPKK